MRGRRRRIGGGLVTAILVLGLVAGLRPAPAAAQSGAAPDGPGALSHFDRARKDCLGTARNRTSKVWFTVANGVLSDVYFPTIDNTNVETLQYVVTDGATFTDLQTRDTTYTVRPLDPSGMSCRVTTTANSGRYRIVTDYLADPGRNALLLRLRFEPLVQGDLRLYLRFDPTVNGNGGGGIGNGGADSGVVDSSTGHPVPVAIDTVTATNAANRDYAQPVYAALDASRPFTEVSNGFAGQASDGLTQLDNDHALTATYAEAQRGNLVQTARVDLSAGHQLTLALGFGATQAQAVGTAGGALRSGFGRALLHHGLGWAAYDLGLVPPPGGFPGLGAEAARELRRVYYLSANVLKASEDKTFPGAIVASLASPWGQAVSAGDPNNTYFGSYREVFARDLYETFTGLLLAGDRATARDTVRFLFERQQLPDGSMPRNSLVNGELAPDSFGTQLDEVTYPILMAWQAGITDGDFYREHIKPAAAFAISHGPSFGNERWEEQGGFSPSTIAAEIAGLIAAADVAERNGDHAAARVYRGVADDFQRSVKGWTVTSNGPNSPEPYFIRLSKTGDPNAAISYNVGNGGPTLDQREVIDAGFLELPRLGMLPADDPDVLRSLAVVDAAIKRDTDSGPGWHRYNGDGYGDRDSDGRPWAPTGVGSGHLWPALAGERAEHHIALGDRTTAARLADSMRRFASGFGLIPEQGWENPDLAASPFGTAPELASIGFLNGGPVGSASPLTWSAAQYVRLVRDIAAGRLLEQPASTVRRYVTNQQQATSLTVTEPPDRTPVPGSPVTVRGTSTPGNTIDVSATNIDADSANTISTTTAAADGGWSVDVPIQGGTIVLDVVATSPQGGTAHQRRTVVFDFTPGEVLLDVTDPNGDDNGPGNYAYPTSDNFRPGAFDIQRFQVLDAGTEVIFRLQTRNLSPTFGSGLGAQLVDVYVRDPGATQTSTAASFTQRNYQIAPDSAWSRLIEVQGFGQRYVDAGGATLGTVTIRANEISRFITFSVPKSSLGQPGPGWGFAVVLTGQDGFSPDQARGFAATPQEFQFGVCASPPDPSNPLCGVDPGTVPKAMDVITPEGVSQADELNYVVNDPVTLQGVRIS
jgi:glucan 1,4-alpha-glucosidase